MQPSADTIAAFDAFAKANGLETTVTSPNGEWVSITTTVSKANELFGASFETYTHDDLPEPLTRTMVFSLPEELVGHVNTMHPTTSFDKVKGGRPKTKTNKAESAETFDCNELIVPTCLQQLYGIPATPATQKNNTLLVTGYVDEFVDQTDVSVRGYFECFPFVI